MTVATESSLKPCGANSRTLIAKVAGKADPLGSEKGVTSAICSPCLHDELTNLLSMMILSGFIFSKNRKGIGLFSSRRSYPPGTHRLTLDLKHGILDLADKRTCNQKMSPPATCDTASRLYYSQQLSIGDISLIFISQMSQLMTMAYRQPFRISLTPAMFDSLAIKESTLEIDPGSVSAGITDA